MDAKINKLHKSRLSHHDINVLKMQAHILTYLNDDLRNIVHLACLLGDLPLLEFLIEKADLLEFKQEVITAKDELLRTPYFLLCSRGYRKKFCEGIQKQKGHRKKMIELLIPEGKFHDPQSSRWDITAKQVKNSALHWLAYYNDVESIMYILNNLPLEAKDFSNIMTLNSRGLTPLDVAAKHKCHEAAITFIDFFMSRPTMLNQIYLPKGNKKIDNKITNENKFK